MVIFIAPGLILLCVIVIALIALAHLTAGALIAIAAIFAIDVVITALAVAWIHGRVVPQVRPFRSHLSAEVLSRDGTFMELPPTPVWTAETVLDGSEPPTRAQLEAAFRYMASVYGKTGQLPELEEKDVNRKDDHGC